MVFGPLASVANASYPILVHQPTASFHASFRRSVALPPLRFPSLAVTCSGEDLHLQDDAHAGRTEKGPPPGGKAALDARPDRVSGTGS